jgi:hypothetical protein
MLPALRGEMRERAVRLGSQYGESAAWLHEDAGDLAIAQYWTGRAMEWAHEADDDVMLAWTLYRRSQQAAAAGDVAQALGLAHAARRREDRLPAPMRSAIRVQEAYGHPSTPTRSPPTTSSTTPTAGLPRTPSAKQGAATGRSARTATSSSSGRRAGSPSADRTGRPPPTNGACPSCRRSTPETAAPP